MSAANLRPLFHCCHNTFSGRSAAWLAHLLGVQEVGRSNRLAPTTDWPIRQFLNCPVQELPRHSTLMTADERSAFFFGACDT